MRLLRRTQIYLTPKQHQALKRLSAEKNSTVAELVRYAIDRFLGELEPPENDPLDEIIGIGASGKKDSAQHHNEFICTKHW